MTRISLLPIITIFLCIYGCPASAAFSQNDTAGNSVIHASIDTGAIAIDDDLFIPIRLELGLATRNFELVIQGPLRLRVMDNAPQDEALWREQDWDERSDWARIVRNVRFQKTFRNGRVNLHAGELNGTDLGYGEIVCHYFNSIDMDHYHGGIEGFAEVRGNGAALMLDDVLAPSIFAGRFFLAPFSWFTGRRLGQRFQIGAHLFVDKGVPSRTLASSNNRLVSAGTTINFVTVDTVATAIDTYLSLGAMDGDAGFHGGIVADVAISQKKRQGFRFQTEFRYVGEDYYPALVNPFYNHNRRFFSRDPATGEQNTFTDHLANTTMNVQAAPGFMADVEIQLNEILHFGARYDYQARNRPHWIMFRFELSPSDNVSVRGFYAGQDAAGGSELFSADALMGLAYHHRIVGPLRLFSEFSRRLRRLDDDNTAFANETSLGLGLIFSY